MGKQWPKAFTDLPGGRGRETSASEMVPAPFPKSALDRVKNQKASDTQGFSKQPEDFRGRGKGPSQTPKFLSPLPG